MALKSDGDKVMTTVILTRAQKQRLDEQAGAPRHRRFGADSAGGCEVAG